MNKISSRIAVLGLAALLTQSAFAAPRATSGGGHGFWAGMSTDAVLGTTIPSLTGLLTLSDKTAIQLYFGIASTSSLGGGFAFKYNALGDTAKGVHIGAGLGLGTNAGFYINIVPLMGLHLEVADGLLLHADAGLAFNIPSSGGLGLRLGGQSAQMGISAVYRI